MKVSVSLGYNTVILDTFWDREDWWENRSRLLDMAFDNNLQGFIDER